MKKSDKEPVMRRRFSAAKLSICIFFFCGDVVSVTASNNSFFDFSRAITSHMPNIRTRTVTPVRLQQKPQSAKAVSLVSTKAKPKRRKNNTGFYYGIREDVFFKPFEEETNENSSSGEKRSPGKYNLVRAWTNNKNGPNSRAGLTNVMGETLVELREMREEITALRKEMALMKKQLSQSSYDMIERDDYNDGSTAGREDGYSAPVDSVEEDELAHHPQGITGFVARRKRQKEFDQIGMDIENWARELVSQNGSEELGWKEVQCNRMFKNKFNKRGNIRCFLKWMPDSRGKHASRDADKEYPCVKVIASIDAPVSDVCEYLSEEARLPEYNDLVIEHRDIEDISPHSKICWGSSPQILFIKPRDFVTFCHHHWKKDGTQVVVNQAVEHEDAPAVEKEGDGKYCRAYALRGANFIAQDPDDPNKTIFTILSHADPGGGIPPWAMKTAVNAVAPIEPFKLFHKIEQRVIASIKDRENRTQNVSAIPGRSSKPGGLSQIGYACFWPNGGGLKEGYFHHTQQHYPQQQHHHDSHSPQPSSSQLLESNPSHHNNQHHSQQISSAENLQELGNAQLMVQEKSQISAEPVSNTNFD